MGAGSPQPSPFEHGVLPDLDVEKLSELAAVRTRAAKAVKILVGAPALIHVDATPLEQVGGQSKVEAPLSPASRLHHADAPFEVGVASVWIDD